MEVHQELSRLLHHWRIDQPILYDNLGLFRASVATKHPTNIMRLIDDALQQMPAGSYYHIAIEQWHLPTTVEYLCLTCDARIPGGSVTFKNMCLMYESKGNRPVIT